jgi:hypothetical protein
VKPIGAFPVFGAPLAHFSRRTPRAKLAYSPLIAGDRKPTFQVNYGAVVPNFVLSRLMLLVVVGIVATLAVSHALPIQSFDGQWSVQVTPEDGGCEGIYVLPVEVAAGTVTYIGRAAIRAEGGIRPDGSVRVSFVMEADRLDAKGTMSNSRFGLGSWTSPTEGCQGTWIARKRR